MSSEEQKAELAAALAEYDAASRHSFDEFAYWEQCVPKMPGDPADCHPERSAASKFAGAYAAAAKSSDSKQHIERTRRKIAPASLLKFRGQIREGKTHRKCNTGQHLKSFGEIVCQVQGLRNRAVCAVRV